MKNLGCYSIVNIKQALQVTIHVPQALEDVKMREDKGIKPAAI